MSDKSSENYLDNLLGSVNGTVTAPEVTAPEKEPQKEPESDTKKSIFEETKLSADDEFLREFEAELESDAYKDYFADFEAELEAEQQRELKLQMQESGNKGDMESILKDLEKISKDIEPVPAMPDPGTDSAKAVLEAMEQQEAAHRELGGLDDFEDTGGERRSGLRRNEITDDGDVEEIKSLDELDQLLAEIEEIGETEAGMQEPLYKVTEEGEPDLAGNGDDELDDILAAADGLSDIGGLLNGEGLDAEDTIGEYAENEMQQEENSDGEGKAVNDKKKRRGKKQKDANPGRDGQKTDFMEKLKSTLFGEDEEDSLEDGAEQPAKGDSANPAAELSEENRQILKELEGEENPKKEKKKKAKKPKKEKSAKAKPVRAKKSSKPKKEKVKEVDNTPPLPKGPVILILLMTASLVALILLGTSLLGYNSGISQAKSMYNAKRYTQAYAQLQGMDIKEKDYQLYGKAQVLATVDSKYQSYLVFHAYGDEIGALDSLICAAGRYDLNMDGAAEFECQEEFAALGEKIEAILTETYGISMEDAVEIYSQHNRTEYSIVLHRTLVELGLEQETAW